MTTDFGCIGEADPGGARSSEVVIAALRERFMASLSRSSRTLFSAQPKRARLECGSAAAPAGARPTVRPSQSNSSSRPTPARSAELLLISRLTPARSTEAPVALTESAFLLERLGARPMERSSASNSIRWLTPVQSAELFTSSQPSPARLAVRRLTPARSAEASVAPLRRRLDVHIVFEISPSGTLLEFSFDALPRFMGSILDLWDLNGRFSFPRSVPFY